MDRFKHILGVIDPRGAVGTVLDRALSLARNNQAKLTIVDVVPRMTAGIGMPDGGPISADLQQAVVADTNDRLQQVLAPYREHMAIQSKVLVGTPFLEIVREVLREQHDLVIKTPEDPGWLDRLFGSDDMHLLRKCPCALWLVKQSATEPHSRILAAVDVGSAHPADELPVRQSLNKKVLELAVSLSLSGFAELHVANICQAIGENALRSSQIRWPDSEVGAYVETVRQQHETALDSLMDDVVRLHGRDAVEYLKPRRHLIKGQARREIPRLVDELDIDLVVMGTVARTGVPGFIIGNTAEAILEQINCSVLAVKPEGFETPIAL